MRENIYQRTKADLIAGEEQRLENYIQRLEIRSPSYDYDARKEILLRWANQMKCNWLTEKRFVNLVLKELENEKLPTPYNIYAFTLSTGINRSTRINNEHELRQIVHEHSKKTAETYATNIREINKDEYHIVLYACFPFISNEYPKVYVERKFNEIMDDINPNGKDYNKYKFSAAANYHYGKIISSPAIQFVHPSLSEALPKLLMRDNSPDQHIQNLFSKVLIYLGNDVINLKTICTFILKNYEILVNKDLKNLLNKVIDSRDFKYGILNEVFANFDRIEESLKTKAIELLKTDDKVLASISDFSNFNPYKLPSSATDKLLELAKTDDKVLKSIITIVFANFDRIEESLKTKAIELKDR